jgi:hydrogenase maturation protein HypF
VKSCLHITIRGAVQGVGFRPFIYRLATEMNLKGFVLNSPSGVFIEVDGEKTDLDNLLLRVGKEKPPRAIINSFEFSFLDPGNFTKFEIRESKQDGEISASILPDIAVCSDCLTEMFDPKDRRFLYPFINCTNCGPRFSIIESLPYDRPNTSMKIFPMCEECTKEYENPLNRRFHAQPTACPVCGPHIELCDVSEKVLYTHKDSLMQVADLLNQGKIIALKGLGGFQLLCDARNDEGVARLRQRKHREEKPFALMFPTIESVRELCSVNQFEERLLLSAESPIVLLRRKFIISSLKSEIKNQLSNIDHPTSSITPLTSHISNSVAPSNPYLGVMLPYTPLHHLLMKLLGFPVIATSGNLSEEPMCINETEALERLKDIADYFLVHNRPIVRQVDDSIVRIVNGREMVMRRARGYAPLPITLDETTISVGKSIIAVGAHLKNTIAVNKGREVFISQHIGDLSTNESFEAFGKTINDFKRLYRIESNGVVCDMHPDYLSTRYATEASNDASKVQHHAAHVFSCRAENQVKGRALGVAWDGTGFGDDESIWGGEFFMTDENSYHHVGQFRQFLLPGGEAAVKESRRSLLGVLHKAYGDDLFKDSFFQNILLKKYSSAELKSLRTMLAKIINCPLTSSAGRLFDAISSLLNICDTSTYEGKAAMMLEFVADESVTETYPFVLEKGKLLIINWKPMLDRIIEDLNKTVSVPIISAKFHNTLAEIILGVAQKFGENKIVLSGGCFQNVLLLEKTINHLESKGFHVYHHQRIPTNDGGISLGQMVVALNAIKKK